MCAAVTSYAVWHALVHIQTVTSHMDKIEPPVAIADPKNKPNLKYVQDEVSQANFDYTPVSCSRLP